MYFITKNRVYFIIVWVIFGVTWYFSGQVITPSSAKPDISSPFIQSAMGSQVYNIFHPYETYLYGTETEALTIGDFNHDGRNDVVMVSRNGGNPSNLLLFLQTPNGTLGSPTSFLAGNYINSVATGDINNDNRDDLIVANGSDITISVFLQQNNGTLGSQITYPTVLGPDLLVVADFNNDTLDDVVVWHMVDNVLGVFYQNNSGTLNNMVSYSATKAWLYDDMDYGDVNNDGRTDIVLMYNDNNNPSFKVYLQQINGTLGSPITYSLPNTPYGVAIGDVTNDGLDDVVIARANIEIFVQMANGTLSHTISFPGYAEAIEVEDINLDGRLDIIGNAASEISVHLQLPDGTFTPYDLYQVPYSAPRKAQSLDIGDVSNDGLPDVVNAVRDYGLNVLRHQEIDFTLSVFPDEQTASPGGQVNSTVMISSTGGLVGPVAVEIASVAGWITPTLPVTTTIIPNQLDVITFVAQSTPFGNYSLPITATTGVITQQVLIDFGVRSLVHLPATLNTYCFAPFIDDFSNPLSGWPNVDTGNIVYGYINGQYQIFHRLAYRWGGVTAGSYWSNGELAQVRGRIVQNSGSWGLIFGLNENWTDFYSFEIFPSSQEYYLFHYTSSTGWSIERSGFSTGISTSGFNTMAIHADPSSGIQLQINNYPYAYYPEVPGRVGLSGSSLAANTDIRFDNYLFAAENCPVSALTEIAPDSYESLMLNRPPLTSLQNQLPLVEGE